MPAITLSADGEYLFLALENTAGNQIILKAARATPDTYTIAYSPGTGSAGNVAPCVANPDLMFFYGNFGTDILLVKHTVSTGAETDISPSGLGAAVANTLAINPSNPDEIVLTVDTDQDLKYSSDGGGNWEDWDAALGFDAMALAVLWSGVYGLDRYLVAGDNGVDLDLVYSPNEGASSGLREDASLEAQAAICAIEVRES